MASSGKRVVRIPGWIHPDAFSLPCTVQETSTGGCEGIFHKGGSDFETDSAKGRSRREDSTLEENTTVHREEVRRTHLHEIQIIN